MKRLLAALAEFYAKFTGKRRTSDKITEIGIDPSGRLFVRPAKVTFEYIYRSAMEVHWDETEMFLFSPQPRAWTYPQWFRQILDAAADEYGIRLNITEKTVWSNVPDAIRREIEETCLQNI